MNKNVTCVQVFFQKVIKYDQHKTAQTDHDHKTRKSYPSPNQWHGSSLGLMTSLTVCINELEMEAFTPTTLSALAHTPALQQQKETRFTVTMRTLLLASVLFAGPFACLALPVPGPYHAFCRTLWWVKIADLCPSVSILCLNMHVWFVFFPGMFNSLWFQMKAWEIWLRSVEISFCFNVNPPKLWYFSRLFATPCAEISTKLIKQIQDFNPLTGCDECHYMVRSTSVNVNDVFFSTGEIYFRVMTRCFLFQVVSATNQSIKANHTSPDGLQCENITLSLSPTVLTGGCRVSVSICDANSLTVASMIQSHTAASCFNKTVLIALWQKAQSFAQ